MTVTSANIVWLIEHLSVNPKDSTDNHALWEFKTFRQTIEFMYEILLVLEDHGFQYKWPLSRKDASAAYRSDNKYIYVSIIQGHQVCVQVG